MVKRPFSFRFFWWIIMGWYMASTYPTGVVSWWFAAALLIERALSGIREKEQ